MKPFIEDTLELELPIIDAHYQLMDIPDYSYTIEVYLVERSREWFPL